MKKVVVILIGAIYIGSVFIVNFFGLQINFFSDHIYQEKIECNSITLFSGGRSGDTVESKIGDDGVKRFSIKFIEGEYTKEEDSLKSNPNTVRLDYRVYPDNATDKSVRIIAEDSKYYVVDNAMKTITFLDAPLGVHITISSADGSDLSEKIYIIIY
ncbi:MAG: hypothetical protein IJ800_04170 [Clostridia bacterium]|nr:hypothetical protein [Clostridia bacterium]